jgi:hypothetical protein
MPAAVLAHEAASSFLVIEDSRQRLGARRAGPQLGVGQTRSNPPSAPSSAAATASRLRRSRSTAWRLRQSRH